MKPSTLSRRRGPIAGLGVLAATLLAACGPTAPASTGGDAPAAAGTGDAAAWRRAPRVLEVVATPAGWAVRGQAAPRARVALSVGPDAFAASADAAGAFEVVVPPGPQARRLSLQTRQGQAVARAPGVLLLPAAGVAAPPLLAAPGQASRAFAAAALVEVVDADSDPAGRVVSGTAGPGTALLLEPGERSVVADAAGRWSGIVSGGGPVTVRAGGRAITLAPVFSGLEAGREVRIAPAGSGWSYAWRLPDGAVRAAWTPASPRRAERPAGRP
ncbi:MAG TPA: hypothetical protein VGN74_00790 [Brevundimonas sp.]|jgi:hypothetical protein|uniref:hypothetical protein n=1 Tax=Brevundimonas sp. TaxID=1871086 RepID=UPI002E11633E|nr:hypothetical protein [Brevundimonas sp.]